MSPATTLRRIPFLFQAADRGGIAWKRLVTAQRPHPLIPQPHRETPALKVFLGATPKTGNVWLKTLLAEAYGLRVVEVSEFPDESSLHRLGTGWIAHQHFSPSERLLELFRQENVVVITVLRHPGDVLVSLRSFLGNLDNAFQRDDRAATMLDDGENFGPAALEYVRNDFAAQVNLSLLWWKTGATPVRYESLRKDPLNTLRSLTPLLGPVPDSRLQAAIALSNIGRLRQKTGKTAFHFRAGRSGDWRKLLTPEIIEVFRNQSPYPAQFEALGYSLEATDSPTAAPAAPVFKDPFRGATQFEDGTPLCDFLVAHYFESVADPMQRWPDPTLTSVDDSYFAWLNGAADDDPHRDGNRILVTRLARAIHAARPDLQRAFPDPFENDRLAFSNWFILFAKKEFGLAPVFLTAVFESIAALQPMPPMAPMTSETGTDASNT